MEYIAKDKHRKYFFLLRDKTEKTAETKINNNKTGFEFPCLIAVFPKFS